MRTIEGTGDKSLAALEEMRRNMPMLLEFAAMNAKIKRAYYAALIEQKFTPEQALVMCCHSMTV